MTEAEIEREAAQHAREMSVGESIYWRGVAQQKPALRKAILSGVSGMGGEYAVRYVGFGVEMTRVA